jgi:aspartyl-tRNA(Asn)/glutamyl-tRNA(Gln) amidotransferase subunit A
MDWSHASEIAAAVGNGRTSAGAVVGAALARIAELNPVLNAFTAVVEERALARAEAIDAALARGRASGALAGVPFAVKNLFDIAGLPTLAGSKINRDRAPAARDATLIARLEAQGAVLVGALNMGEYAYDFTGENVHDGASRNPHDIARMTGGSSGGSGGAVAGGMVPLSLGSDTNGSIRVPASLCGIFGLKPTYGRLSRAHTFPFVASLDHVGPLARSARDLALAYDAMQGHDPADPVCADRPVEAATPLLDRGSDGLRIAIAGGYFRTGAFPEAQTALARVAAALGVKREIEIPEAQRARAAAYLITAAEGAALHLERLRTRARDFDPAVRDRLIAGAMIPAAGDALHRAADRPADLPARRRRAARARQSRHLHPADLVRRPAGRDRAGEPQANADRRADHRRAVARGNRIAHCACARAGRRRRREQAVAQGREVRWTSTGPRSSPR